MIKWIEWRDLKSDRLESDEWRHQSMAQKLGESRTAAEQSITSRWWWGGHSEIVVVLQQSLNPTRGRQLAGSEAEIVIATAINHHFLVLLLLSDFLGWFWLRGRRRWGCWKGGEEGNEEWTDEEEKRGRGKRWKGGIDAQTVYKEEEKNKKGPYSKSGEKEPQ